jgi:hypothetical protein
MSRFTQLFDKKKLGLILYFYKSSRKGFRRIKPNSLAKEAMV